MIEIALIAVAAIGPVGGAGTVRGTILSDRDEPVFGVQVELPGENRMAWSDFDGRYELGELDPGEYEIRFSRFAYDPLSLTITVPEGGAVELDIRLKTRFVVLPGITVVTSEPASRPFSLFLSSGLPEIGSRELPAALIWSSPLVEQPDVLATLRTVPGVDLAEESATQIHVRGGSADQNLVLLDGAPVYNGNHTSGILSAIPPDAVSRMVVHTGVLPARYGGRLSSVIDVETAMPSREGTEVRGGLGVPDARLAVQTRLPGRGGEVLLAGRRTTYDLVRRGYSKGAEDSGFEDVLGRVSFGMMGGTLRIVSLHTDNWLSSFAGVRPGVDDAATGLELAVAYPDLHNSVEWSSGTDAVAWSRGSESGSELHLQLFRAATRSSIEWGSLSERHRMHNRLVHWGASGDLAWKDATSLGRGGVAVEWLSSAYDTTARVIGDLQESGYSRVARPTIVSSYLEHRWIPRDHWMINSGLRAVHVEAHGAGLEPRFSAHYRPTERLTVSAGFGRVHQYVQSLSNEESLLNSAYAIEPLIAAGSSGVPLARSDQLAVAAEGRLADRLLLTIDAYARWLDDIVLVAPVSTGPFATAGFERGEGSARGIGLELAYDGDRVEGRALGDWSSVRRTAGGVTYHPRFERRRSLALEGSYRLTGMTRLTAAVQAASGLPTSLLEDGFDWEVFDQLTGEVEFGGTPVRAPGQLNADRLPPYVRLDLGVRKEWHVGGLADGTLAGYLNVMNVLDRDNVLGRQLLVSDSETRELLLLPRSLLFGIEWRF